MSACAGSAGLPAIRLHRQRASLALSRSHRPIALGYEVDLPAARPLAFLRLADFGSTASR
jgi:hypothetical protein